MRTAKILEQSGWTKPTLTWHCRDDIKGKTWNIFPTIPGPPTWVGGDVVTNDWCRICNPYLLEAMTDFIHRANAIFLTCAVDPAYQLQYHLDSQLTGERGGSVVECRTPEREVRGSRPTAAVLCP